MTRTLLFRADGDAESGLGHLYRLLGLIDIVADRHRYVLLTREGPATAAIPEHVAHDRIPSHVTTASEPDWLADRYDPSRHLMIADGYQFCSAYRRACTDAGFGLVYVDDLGGENMHADAVVNHSLGARAADFAVSGRTRLYLGSDYALLRRPFLDAARGPRPVPRPGSVFVCFGGSDPHDFTARAALGLSRSPAVRRVVVVTGEAYRHERSLTFESDKIECHRSVASEEMVELMRSCRIAVVAASTVMYEAMAINMPILSGFFVDNQIAFYEAALERGLINGLGSLPDYDFSELPSRVSSLDARTMSEQLDAQRIALDGRQEERLLEMIEDLAR